MKTIPSRIKHNALRVLLIADERACFNSRPALLRGDGQRSLSVGIAYVGHSVVTSIDTLKEQSKCTAPLTGTWKPMKIRRPQLSTTVAVFMPVHRRHSPFAQVTQRDSDAATFKTFHAVRNAGRIDSHRRSS